MSAADQPFIVPEKRLAEALGLPRSRIKDIRTLILEKGRDWSHVQGGEVRFSRLGIESTLAELQIPPEKIALLLPLGDDAPPLTPPATPAAPEPRVDSLPNDPPPPPAALPPEPSLDLAAPSLVEVTVKKCFSVNRRLVLGTTEIKGAPAYVRVRVKSNEKLRPGMVLRCTHLTGDLYQLAQRLPRWLGKA